MSTSVEETIETELFAWIEKQSIWQRNLIKRIVRGEEIDKSYIDSIAQGIIDNSVKLEEPSLSIDEFSAGDDSAVPIVINSIGDLKNVNALLEDEHLTFGAEGITIIYGDNGCGKSGYARIAKNAVGARHSEEVLANVFAPQSDKTSAKIKFSNNGSELESVWPDNVSPLLQQIHFYDEACGDDYIEKKTELKYRPSVLGILDKLVVYIDEIRSTINLLITTKESVVSKLPVVPPGTPAEAFLSNLSESVSVQDIDNQIDHPIDLSKARIELIQEDARLKTTDPSKEKLRFEHEVREINNLVSHIDFLHKKISPETGLELITLKRKSLELKEAAEILSKTSFENEPIKGIGTSAWRALWQAAEDFSTKVAFPEQIFPVTSDDSACVLCQQPLSESAQQRLKRFRAFVENDVSRQADETEIQFNTNHDNFVQISIYSEDLKDSLKTLESYDEPLASKVKLFLNSANQLKTSIIENLSLVNDNSWEPLPKVNLDEIRSLAQTLKQKADKIDNNEFQNTLSDCQQQLSIVEGKIALKTARNSIEAEIDRLKEISALRNTYKNISTRLVSKISGELTRKYVTSAVEEQFQKEAKNLKLDHVILGDAGAEKGKLSHKPTLSGASIKSPRYVLSEGEQTAAGLAGFLTEVYFDTTNSSVILDDPMSSLDHERRGKAARRLVEFAQSRQVIVFTHDLVFLGELVKFSKELGVKSTERSVQRANGSSIPGKIYNHHPWKAKDAAERINQLSTELDSIEKNHKDLPSDEYERLTSDWAGKLSETWERIVRSEVAFKIVDRGTTEVRPLMFRIVEKITSDDSKEFQVGYSSTSKWARRHDKSEEVNYVPPTISEMSCELDRIKNWFNRVKKYSK